MLVSTASTSTIARVLFFASIFSPQYNPLVLSQMATVQRLRSGVTRNGNGFSVSPMLADACCRAPVFPVFLTPFAVAIAVVSGYFNAPRNEAVEDPAASNCGAIG